jgi:RNA polymerase sigma-70 factor (ECF subfamily)
MAEDVTQETFCKLLYKFHLFVGKGKFKFILANIVKNMCKKITKKQKMLSIDVLSKMNNEVFLVDLKQYNPIEKIIENEKVEAINAAVEKLSDVYLFMVKGYWYNDMTLLQLACKLNLSLATVESMMFEALNKMHEYLEIEYSKYTYIHITKG